MSVALIRFYSAILVCMLIAAAGTAQAHVEFTTPASGATLTVDTATTVGWKIIIPHSTNNWDLELSSDSGVSWAPVAIDISASALSYPWTPTDACSACILRITMDNGGANYTDTLNITVDAPPDDGDTGCSSTPASWAIFTSLLLICFRLRRLQLQPSC